MYKKKKKKKKGQPKKIVHEITNFGSQKLTIPKIVLSNNKMS